MTRPPCTEPIAPPSGGFWLIAGWAVRVDHLIDLLNELGDNPNTVVFGAPAPEIDMLNYSFSKRASWEGPNKPECNLCWPLPLDDVPRWVVVSFINMTYDGYLKFNTEGPLIPNSKFQDERVDLFKEKLALGTESDAQALQDLKDNVLKHIFFKDEVQVGKDTVEFRSFLDPKQAQYMLSSY